jgi:hypothetical protein
MHEEVNTVGELRKQLTDIPDDTPISVWTKHDRYPIFVDVIYNYLDRTYEEMPENAHSVDLNIYIKD